jgi:hypothetical protein
MNSRLLAIRSEEVDDTGNSLNHPPEKNKEETYVPNNKKERVEQWELVSLGMKVLNQRAVQVFGYMLPLFALIFGFILVWSVKESPSITQIILVIVYGVFSTGLILIRR